MERKIIHVSTATMEGDPLFRRINASKLGFNRAKFDSYVAQMRVEMNNRHALEQRKERMVDHVLCIADSPDSRFLVSARDSVNFQRLCWALKVNVTALAGSNLKSFAKLEEIADLVIKGSDIQKVTKAWTVCAYIANTRFGRDVLPRAESELFLNTLSHVRQGTSELFEAIDEIRAQIATGAPTQTSQIVRSLVTLGGAEDVCEGRHKHTRVLPDSPVMQALMRRLGQVTAPSSADV
jgi:hypothetical protein